MQNGIVQWFHPTKGYGFIRPLYGDEKDVFVHIDALRKSGLGKLHEGQRVAFVTELRGGRVAASHLSLA